MSVMVTVNVIVVDCVTLIIAYITINRGSYYWEQEGRCGYTGRSEGTIDYITSSSSKCDYSTTKSVCLLLLCYLVGR